MPDPEQLDAPDLYSERLIRSVAHNIGNAVNVLSGRLSLLEMEEGMKAESLEMLALMKDRLRRTQGELRGAVRFVSETLRETEVESAKTLNHVLTAILESEPNLGTLAGKDAVVANDVAQKCRTSGDLKFALNVLGKGVRALLGEDKQPEWSVDAKTDGVTLEVAVASTLLPRDRRSLMEPWFEPAAMNLSLTERKARLELAVALGRLEDGGANVSVLPLVDGEPPISRLQVLWNYG